MSDAKIDNFILLLSTSSGFFEFSCNNYENNDGT